MNTTQKCPMCAEQIPADAVLCPYCGTHFGEEVQAAPPLAEPVQPVSPAPLPAPLPAKKSHAGLWIAGALVLIVLCGVIGAVLWNQRASLPVLSGLFATPTPTATPTLPPTLTPTITLTGTPSNTLTPTGTPLPDWAINFSKPILLAIQGRPPDFQDDFHDQSGGWSLYYCADWRMQFVAGELVMTNCDVGNERLKYTDFVLEVDARFVSYDPADGRWGVYLASDINISINNWGEISWMRNWTPMGVDSGMAHPGAASNHILLIVKGTEYALYVNDQPLSYIVNDTFRGGSIGLFVPRLDQTKYETVVAFDNFKIWDISDLP